MIDILIDFALFCGTVALLPVFLISTIILHLSRKLFYTILQLLHPDVEFLNRSTIRTLLDTHRNQGIVSVLLSIKGPPQPAAIRRHLQEVIKRRDKAGNLAFPRLRHSLVTRCGTYAWAKEKFDLDQNITVAPLSYKGRAITEYNIQEYVSEIVSKYLPSAMAPWQIIIIASSEDQHYILLKLHHVLLDEGVNIGDLLPLIPPTRVNSDHFITKSPIVDVLDKPKAIPELLECLNEEICNFLNEFVSNYDPLECPELLKNSLDFIQFHCILIITIIASFREIKKGFKAINCDILSRLRYIMITLKKEARKRNITFRNYIKSFLMTFIDPRKSFKMCYAVIKTLLGVPIMILNELLALYSCIFQNYCHYPKTLIGISYKYVPLIIKSLNEIIAYLVLLIKSPRIVLQDVLFQKESFQTITLCGRKSVAWSSPVKSELIKTIAKNKGVSSLEVMLCAISASISKYLTQTKHIIPDYLAVTLRNVNSNYIFATGANVKPEDSVSGILSLELPVLDPDKESSLLEVLVNVKKNLKKALERQGFWHLMTLIQTKTGFLTKMLPASVLGVYLRYLSRKYSVQVTELSSRYPNMTQRTVWGQEVTSVVYWRPPQANSSVSLCLNEYADHVKVGVMCDSQLAPHHPVLVRGFPEYVRELSKL